MFIIADGIAARIVERLLSKGAPFLQDFRDGLGIGCGKFVLRKRLLHTYKSYEDDRAPVVPPTLVAMQIANYLGTDVLEIWGDQLGGGTA